MEDINSDTLVNEYMIPPMEYDIGTFSYDKVKIAQTYALRRIPYTDTDSSFADIFYLLTYIAFGAYSIQPEELFKKIKMFSDDDFDEKFKRQDLIDIIQSISKNLETLINDNILVKFALKHGIPKKFNKLDFKQEYIFSAIYLNADKNYLYRAIAEKGRMIDEFDSLNIGVKSDKAEIANKVIKDLSIIMLKYDVQTSLAYSKNFLRQFKTAIAEKNLKISVPASLNKPFEEYKKVTQTSRAALIFEIVTGNRGSFTPGSKGKLFCVNSFNWDLIPNADFKMKQIESEFLERWGIHDVRSKLDVILIHEEYENNFNYDWFNIDENRQLARVILKPLNQLYAPLGINIANEVDVDPKLLK